MAFSACAMLMALTPTPRMLTRPGPTVLCCTVWATEPPHRTPPYQAHVAIVARQSNTTASPMQVNVSKLWVWFLCFGGVHHDVVPERLLFAAPQSYLRRQRSRSPRSGDQPYYSRPPLHLLKTPLQHGGRADPGMGGSGVAKVGIRA